VRKLTSAKYPDTDPQFLYELSKDRLATQLSFLDAVDGKIGLLLSTGSALLGILAAALALKAHEFDRLDLALLSSVGLCFIVLASAGLFAYFGRRWSVGPKLEQVKDDLVLSTKENEVKWKTTTMLIRAYNKNAKTHARKLLAMRVAVVALIAESGVLLIALSSLAVRG
jgi:hypothetical protein